MSLSLYETPHDTGCAWQTACKSTMSGIDNPSRPGVCYGNLRVIHLWLGFYVQLLRQKLPLYFSTWF